MTHLDKLIIDYILESRELYSIAGMKNMRKEHDLSDWHDPYVKICMLYKLISLFNLNLDSAMELFVALHRRSTDGVEIEALEVVYFLDEVKISNAGSLGAHLDGRRTLVDAPEKMSMIE